jgi:hypothetical protein
MAPFLLASGFAKATYSGDDTQYWGKATVMARHNLFANASATDASWDNMDAYRWVASCGPVAHHRAVVHHSSAPIPAISGSHKQHEHETWQA